MYFIALLPSTRIQKQVLTIKHEFKNKYASAHALKSPAHITLYMPFKTPPSEEPRIIRVLTRFANTQSSFSITLNNFGKFSHRVIYIGVEKNIALHALHKNLLNALAEELGLTVPQKNTFTPHITVATRDLSRDMASRAWKEFSTRQYSAECTARSISLLKHTGTHWVVHKSFAFGNDISHT